MFVNFWFYYRVNSNIIDSIKNDTQKENMLRIQGKVEQLQKIMIQFQDA